MDNTHPPRWTRVVLVLLGLPQVVVGTWAVVATRHWFDTFPGFGPLLVAAEPPFNHHLASDAGAGFLATGVVALVAAAWGRREVVVTAALGLFAFALPHFLYHAAHPAPALSTAVNAGNAVVLGIAALVPAAVAVGAWRGVRTSRGAG
ncbi:MAG: hypothetical protein QM728_03700 [Gordonia sp. (in: high G+C Gram-positive bacteria)]|uniref:hypothetical protein n=1 Tax=Gordonia sp. (in: high G+C Gram-positive bacteria) TaxID=84139 RepID=UPI0039E2304A